jgi:AcrR family transcriptional regulator
MTSPRTKSRTRAAKQPAAPLVDERADERADDEPVRRGRGRPRRDIDREEVADAVEALFEEGGYEAVSIEETAKRLTVSRATLYRTVPSKEHLLAILFERMTTELYDAALEIVENPDLTPRERVEQATAVVDDPQTGGDVRLGRAHQVEVAAGGEDLAGRGQHDGTDLLVPAQRVQHLRELDVQLVVEAVEQLGPGQGDLGDVPVGAQREGVGGHGSTPVLAKSF